MARKQEISKRDEAVNNYHEASMKFNSFMINLWQEHKLSCAETIALLNSQINTTANIMVKNQWNALYEQDED